MKTRMYNPGRQKSLGLLGAWCSSFEKSAEKPVEIPLWDQNSRIVTRIVLEEALAHRIVMGLWWCSSSSASHGGVGTACHQDCARIVMSNVFAACASSLWLGRGYALLML